MGETRRRLGACVRLRGTFRTRILTILSRSINQSINQKRIRVTKVTNVTARPLRDHRSVMTTNNSAK